jgi:hypothetical protein
MKTTEYHKFNKSQLYVHLELESLILTDLKSTTEEENKAIENIRYIKDLITNHN